MACSLPPGALSPNVLWWEFLLIGVAPQSIHSPGIFGEFVQDAPA